MIEALHGLVYFKLQQGASITPNVGLSVGTSKKFQLASYEVFIDNTNIYYCWGVL